MKNDTRVFYPVTDDSLTSEARPISLWKGTIEAIHRDGFKIDPMSEDWCPHEWINEHGYLDPELAQKHPYTHAFAVDS